MMGGCTTHIPVATVLRAVTKARNRLGWKGLQNKPQIMNISENGMIRWLLLRGISHEASFQRMGVRVARQDGCGSTEKGWRLEAPIRSVFITSTSTLATKLPVSSIVP